MGVKIEASGESKLNDILGKYVYTVYQDLKCTNWGRKLRG